MEPVEEYTQASTCDTIQREAQQPRRQEDVPHFDHVLGPELLHGFRAQGFLCKPVPYELQEGKRHLKGKAQCRKQEVTKGHQDTTFQYDIGKRVHGI